MKIWQLRFGKHQTWNGDRTREAWVTYILNVEAKTAADAIKEACRYGAGECFTEDDLSEIKDIGRVSK